MIPFFLAAAGGYIIGNSLNSKQYGNGGGVSTTKISKKEVTALIKQLQDVVNDIEYYKKELMSEDLSDTEKNIIENKVSDLVVKRDYLFGMIRFSIRRYLFQKGKPLQLNGNQYDFLKSQGL